MTLADIFKDEKACHSNVDENQAYDYEIIFADCQRVQVLCRMLSRCKLILHTQHRIAQVCGTILQDFDSPESVKSRQQFKSAIHLSKAERHQERVALLIWQASSIAGLVCTSTELSATAADTLTVIRGSSYSK